MPLGDEEPAGEFGPAADLSAVPARSARLRIHPAATACPPSPFHPLAYRGVVAGWPVEWRERWGRRANELEEAGLSWRDAEAQAFVEVWNVFHNR
jgi:hypothetical protein